MPLTTDEQRAAWLDHRCIDCLTNPTSAGRYRCNECHQTYANNGHQEATPHAQQ